MNFNRSLLLLAFIIFMPPIFAVDTTLKVDFRPRPPEMVIDEHNQISGPLLDILEEAAAKLGYKISLFHVDFNSSLNRMKAGIVDIVPRYRKRPDRELFSLYLGPIGYQERHIMFLVKKDQANSIQSYNDLYQFIIGVKEGSAYFMPFDKDMKLKKIPSKDDYNMVRMFKNNRFDTMATGDQSALKKALAKHGVTDYDFADFKHTERLPNYYAMSKKSPHVGLYQALNQELINMRESGRVQQIYQQHDLSISK